RDLDRLFAELDVREPEPAADDPAVSKQPLDLIRMRVGADVEVLRAAAEHQIANAAADQIRGVAVLIEPVEHAQRIGIDVPSRDRMIRARESDGRGYGFASFQLRPTPTST